MSHVARVEIGNYHYVNWEHVYTHILRWTASEADAQRYRYSGKKLEFVEHAEQTWMSCKSMFYFLSWVLDKSYMSLPNVTAFKNEMNRYTKKIPKRVLSRSLRIEIAYRQSYACNVCGLFPLPPDFEVDHIQALEDGGRDVAENLQALCVPCHKTKTRLNRLRKTPQFAEEAEFAHAAMQNGGQVFSKYFRNP